MEEFGNLSVKENTGTEQYDPHFLASRGKRLVAQLIDGFISGGIYVIGLLFSQSPELSMAIMGLGFLALIVIQVYLLTVSGQTIGKKAMGIRIIKADTAENGGFVTNVLLREVVNGLLGIIPLYGLVDTLFIFREDKKCIHDLIAGTQVIDA